VCRGRSRFAHFQRFEAVVVDLSVVGGAFAKLTDDGSIAIALCAPISFCSTPATGPVAVIGAAIEQRVVDIGKRRGTTDRVRLHRRRCG